ncbi:lysophospholipid acyltransferase family protein [Acinetobacter sp. ANC 4648]|uniref:lysophospholipid acyltransferase family protein n=1 Tax=Acinetobacter sp. ANC 4648 TaxID=1977875 RepID=UPI000A330829|nr:lysophospholipid acyltransferase family protein [Acinetobacter sp. ANC 4648]OTG84714.1 lipid A biosynthesis acyltransferase [Acinetobacter sp. ANC 4648]
MTTFSFLRFIPLSVLQLLARLIAFFINTRPQSGMLWKVRVNLSLAYPELSEHDRKRLARESVIKQCLSYAESLKCWAMPPEWSLKQIHTVHHLDVLTNALKDPKGALIIIPHLGTWEMINAWIHQYGTPTIMYKPMKDPNINNFVLEARQRLNASLVPTDATGVKALFKNLKQGGFSIILPDHVPHPSGGVFVPFFNTKTLTSTLASKMAQKTHCRLVGLSCFRREDGAGFDIYCDNLDDPELYHADIVVATTALNKAVEYIINRSPADYMWGYKRFKYLENKENIYKKT